MNDFRGHRTRRCPPIGQRRIREETHFAIFVSPQTIKSAVTGSFCVVNLMIVDSFRTILDAEGHETAPLLEHGLLLVSIKIDGRSSKRQPRLEEEPTRRRQQCSVYLRLAFCKTGSTVGS